MITKAILTGVAVAALTCSVASAYTAHKGAKETYAAPSQPIPYGKVDSYLKATPKQRTAMLSTPVADPTPMAPAAADPAPAAPAPDVMASPPAAPAPTVTPPMGPPAPAPAPAPTPN